MRKEIYCVQCNALPKRHVSTGRMSAAECGRPAGAKGMDTYSVWYECPNGCQAEIQERQVSDWFDNPNIDWGSILPTGFTIQVTDSAAEILDEWGNYICAVQEHECSSEAIEEKINEFFDYGE